MDQAKEEIKQLGKTIRTKAREIQVMRFAAIYAEYISDGKIKSYSLERCTWKAHLKMR